MNKVFFILSLLLISIVAKADSLFDPDKLYIITSLDLKKGGIEPATEGGYPLVYNTNASEDTERALWIITEEKPGKFSFRNSKTRQYIQYVQENTAGKYMKMSDQLMDDLTLFTVKYKKAENNITYWAIAPVTNQNMIFDRRKYNAVGPYQAQHHNNQLFSFKEQNGNYAKIPSIANEKDGYLKSFTLDNTELVYDQKSKTYYCSIPIEQMNMNQKKTIHYLPKKNNYKIKINKQNIASGSTFTFDDVAADKVFSIQILDDENVIHTSKLIFTGLPIVQLYTEGKRWSSRFSPAKIRVTENNKTVTGELLDADIRYRGATAMGYSKKSFAVKLKDEDKKSIDRTYFGLRNDNYWILDAMASDLSRMRNRICTDLWNDFSVAPYFKAQEKNMINGTRGQFVEVFIDNQYWGLYCMTERIDRKQLKLGKYQKETKNIRGVLYKSKNWSNSTMMGRMRGGGNSSYNIPKYNNLSERWDSYKVTYPDLSNKESISWKPLYDITSFVINSDNSTFKNRIAENIDLPVWMDYYLFLELIYARDNHGKNAYFYVYDINLEEKLGIAPWDLDGTWGRDWNRTRTNSTGNFISFMQNHSSGEHHIYRRLRETNAENYNSLLKKRFNELKSGYFSKRSLNKRLDDYLDLLNRSGAKKREENRWNGTNAAIQLDNEVSYMKKWISERIDFLNKQYE